MMNSNVESFVALAPFKSYLVSFSFQLPQIICKLCSFMHILKPECVHIKSSFQHRLTGELLDFITLDWTRQFFILHMNRHAEPLGQNQSDKISRDSTSYLHTQSNFS